MRLLLIRHGETDWNATRRYQGHLGIALNARGRAQARRAGLRLRHYHPRALYTSDIVRAAETAALMAELLGLEPRALPGLREIDVGHWEGLTPEELLERFPEHMAAFDRDPANTVRLGGESYAQLQVRALAAVAQILADNPGDVVVAVTHGGTIRAIVCHVLGLDLGSFGRMWLDNGSISELRYTRDAWRLLRLNDVGHLEDAGFAEGE